jgi:hypothetical protein
MLPANGFARVYCGHEEKIASLFDKKRSFFPWRKRTIRAAAADATILMQRWPR